MKRIPVILVFIVFFNLTLWGQKDDSVHKDSTAICSSAISSAQYLISVSRPDLAIDTLETALALYPENTVILKELADCHFSGGNMKLAEKYYRNLLDLDSGSLPVKMRYMSILYRKGEYSDAIDLGKGLLEEDRNPAVCAMIGDSFNRKMQVDSAIVYYNQALEIRPHYETVVNKLSSLLLKQRKWNDVISLTMSFLETEPDNATINQIKGVAEYSAKDYVSAIKTFTRQLALGDESFDNYLYLGRCGMKINDWYGAYEDLQKAWDLQGSTQDPYLALDIAQAAWRAHKDYDSEVEKWYDTAYGILNPVLYAMYHENAEVLYAEGRWKDCLQELKKALEVDTEDIHLLSQIAECYYQMKNYKQALDWFERSKKARGPDAPADEFVENRLVKIREELFFQDALPPAQAGQR